MPPPPADPIHWGKVPSGWGRPRCQTMCRDAPRVQRVSLGDDSVSLVPPKNWGGGSRKGFNSLISFLTSGAEGAENFFAEKFFEH